MLGRPRYGYVMETTTTSDDRTELRALRALAAWESGDLSWTQLDEALSALSELDALHAEGLLDANMRAALQVAHATLLDAGMRCTLDRRPRRVAREERIELAREAIRDAVRAQGLHFDE